MITTEAPYKTNAFEVEDISNRTNFVFQLQDDKVYCIDTSLNCEGKILFTGDYGGYCNVFGQIPQEDYNAEKHFEAFYQKSLKDMNICFIGWVEEIDMEMIG